MEQNIKLAKDLKFGDLLRIDYRTSLNVKGVNQFGEGKVKVYGHEHYDASKNSRHYIGRK